MTKQVELCRMKHQEWSIPRCTKWCSNLFEAEPKRQELEIIHQCRFLYFTKRSMTTVPYESSRVESLCKARWNLLWLLFAEDNQLSLCTEDLWEKNPMKFIQIAIIIRLRFTFRFDQLADSSLSSSQHRLVSLGMRPRIQRKLMRWYGLDGYQVDL